MKTIQSKEEGYNLVSGSTFDQNVAPEELNVSPLGTLKRPKFELNDSSEAGALHSVDNLIYPRNEEIIPMRNDDLERQNSSIESPYMRNRNLEPKLAFQNPISAPEKSRQPTVDLPKKVSTKTSSREPDLRFTMF